MPLSLNGKTVKITAIMRDTYTHCYSEVADMDIVEPDAFLSVKDSDGDVICLSDVEIYDMAGNMIVEVSRGESVLLAPGIYIAKLGSSVCKFVIHGE